MRGLDPSCIRHRIGAGVGSDCNLRIEQNVATCALKNFDAEANQSHYIEALFSCLAPSKPRVFRIVTYNGRSFNATWSVPKGTASYNLTVVPKINPDFNETYSATGSKECFIFCWMFVLSWTLKQFGSLVKNIRQRIYSTSVFQHLCEYRIKKGASILKLSGTSMVEKAKRVTDFTNQTLHKCY